MLILMLHIFLLIKQTIMNKYFLYGKFIAKQGSRDEIATILVNASKIVSTAKGCKLYIIGVDNSDTNSIYVTEIWDSKEDHNNSLKMEGVTELIQKALPLLNGQPEKGQELEIVGGTGI